MREKSDKRLLELARRGASAPWEWRLCMGLAALVLAGEPISDEQRLHLEGIARHCGGRL